MSCPTCYEKKPAADAEGHCSYACASGGGSVKGAAWVTGTTKKKELMTVAVLADGRIQLSGATFPVRDQIKARGGRWDPAARSWTLPAGTDTVFAPAPVAAAPVRTVTAYVPYVPYVTRDRSGRCCAAATAAMDKGDPYGPLWYHCKLHGSCRSSYTGD